MTKQGWALREVIIACKSVVAAPHLFPLDVVTSARKFLKENNE